MSAEKSQLLQAAAAMASGVLASYAPATPLPITQGAPGTIGGDIPARMAVHWEIFRSYYAALATADGDDVNWPPPKGTGAQTGAALAALVPLLTQLSTQVSSGATAAALAPIVAQLAQLVGLPAPKPAPAAAPISLPSAPA